MGLVWDMLHAATADVRCTLKAHPAAHSQIARRMQLAIMQLAMWLNQNQSGHGGGSHTQNDKVNCPQGAGRCPTALWAMTWSVSDHGEQYTAAAACPVRSCMALHCTTASPACPES